MRSRYQRANDGRLLAPRVLRITLSVDALGEFLLQAVQECGEGAEYAT